MGSLLFAVPSLGVAEIYTGFLGSKAVGGYDTVAYFTEGKPIKGKKKHRVEHLEAKWYFSSVENLELFKKNPEKYAPQYGGYCAWAVGANAARAPGDPKLWEIVDNKLYLNFNKRVHGLWSEDIPGFILSGDKNWIEMNQ